jgi:2-polyprenyl-3-methyl-5-hydroxy-6-metoxy-1,4-benzoquinol methylase
MPKFKKERKMLDAQVIDQAKLEAFVGRAVADLTAGYTGVMVSLGTRLGPYRAMAGAGPLSSRELAERAGCAERYVREWLNAQATGGYLAYHAASDTYELPPEQAEVLANEDSPFYVPVAWNVPASMWADEEKTIAAIQSGGGVSWGDHDRRMACGSAGFFRNGYRANLVPNWLPTLDGVVERLAEGIEVADVGCGHGFSTLMMAEAFPNSRFHGFDTHVASIDAARKHAEAAGAGGRGGVRPGRRNNLSRPAVRPRLLLRRAARPGRPGGRRAPRCEGAGAGRDRDAGRALRA